MLQGLTLWKHEQTVLSQLKNKTSHILLYIHLYIFKPVKLL